MSLNISNVYNKPYVFAGNNYKNNNLKTVSFGGQELITPEVQEKRPQIAAEIKKANKIAIVTHTNPDEDAVGSSAALKNLIATKYSDKKVDALLLKDIPENYKCIKDADSFELITPSNWKEIKNRKYDLVISVDCSTKDKMGKCSKLFDNTDTKKIKIDHHPTGKDFADINLTCPDAASTSQIVLMLADFMEVKLNKNLASDVYLGIIGDTQGFRYNMTKPSDVFEDSSKLTKAGLEKEDIRKISCSVLDYMPKAALGFYTDTIKKINFSKDDQIAYLVEDQTQTSETQKSENTKTRAVLDKIVYTLMPNIEGVKVAMKLKKSNDNQMICSLIGNGVNVGNIAEKFGGGGHEGAASFPITNKNPEEIVQMVDKEFHK